MAEAELKLCVSNEEEEAKKLQNLRVAVEEHENSMKHKLQILNEFKNKIPESEKTVKNAKDELTAIKTELPQLTSNIHRSRTSVEEARSSMQASHSRNRVVEALMNQKTKGKCPGLFGRLVSILK